MKQLNWYQIFGNTHIIPDGRTVTPTDDIQTLLHCANIWDKDYTTPAEVLADDDTLFLICISDNAIDYLVRSTTWATNAALVPVMTSNNTPSGVVSGSSIHNSTYDFWKAFDGDNTTWWQPVQNSSNPYIIYEFPTAQTFYKVGITLDSHDSKNGCKIFTVEGSNDGVTYTTLLNRQTTTDGVYTEQSFDLTTVGSYKYLKLTINQTSNTSGWYYVGGIQYYASSIVDSESAMQYIGASDYASETLLSDSTWATAVVGSPYSSYVSNAYVPTMTDNTHPSGEASASSVYSSSYPAYKAFDGNDSSTWAAVTTSAEQYLQYDFGKKVKTYAVAIRPLFSGGNLRLKTFSVKASDDGLTFETLKALTTISNQDVGTVVYALENAASADMHSKIRLDNMTTYQNEVQIFTVQFYGRENAGVQSWLKAGGITNKKYTTVSEVLSDLTTLAALMSSTDAIDYLVTAKGWATEICSDSNAMADIGMNNYAANTLLADETWGTAICTSTYFKSVLNVENPDMTDNTHPYGEASASSVNSLEYAWKAFDGVDSDYWLPASQRTDNYVQYAFPSDVKIYKMAVTFKGYHVYPARTMKYQYSTDGVSYVDAGNIDISQGSSADVVYTINKGVDYALIPNASRFRVFSATAMYKVNSWSLGVSSLKFYGRKDI